MPRRTPALLACCEPSSPVARLPGMPSPWVRSLRLYTDALLIACVVLSAHHSERLQRMTLQSLPEIHDHESLQARSALLTHVCRFSVIRLGHHTCSHDSPIMQLSAHHQAPMHMILRHVSAVCRAAGVRGVVGPARDTCAAHAAAISAAGRAARPVPGARTALLLHSRLLVPCQRWLLFHPVQATVDCEKLFVSNVRATAGRKGRFAVG